MSHLLKVGFEIEGGWAGKRGASPFKDLTLIKDGSINGQTLRDHQITATHIGEAVSPPIDLQELVGGGDCAIPKWQDWLEAHWPDADPPNRANNTCGFHIHVSVKSLRDYALLSSKSFPFELRERMMTLGKEVNLPKKHYFWSRMEGKNSFCTLLYDPAKQMGIDSKEEINRTRYGWFNFAYKIHGTLEFRALPTFRDAHVAVLFTREYLAFLESWLDQHQSVSLEREVSF